MSINNIVTSFCERIYREKGSQFDENRMKKYNEDNLNYCLMYRLSKNLVKLGNYAMRLTR